MSRGRQHGPAICGCAPGTAPAPGSWVGRPAQPQPRVWAVTRTFPAKTLGFGKQARACQGGALPADQGSRVWRTPSSRGQRGGEHGPAREPRATLVPSDLLAADSHVSAHSAHLRGGTVTVTGQPRDHKPGNAGKSVAFSPGIQAAVPTRIFGAAPTPSSRQGVASWPMQLAQLGPTGCNF